MARKKINLAEATEEWAKATLGQYYERAASRFRTDTHRKSFIQRQFLEEELGLNDIDLLWVEPQYGTIKMHTGGSLDADALRILINSEIHCEDKVFVFDRMYPDGHMGGDTCYGEYIERPEHRIKITFREK